ncbi:MAG: hypothetical protein COS08_02870 [Euryarchaeota archaeon CG01_land_8_20_14_3_00_38_12]|nr:MAG: hypothetical protein COS08_02870 [Euryarchaeota archaeon CG01_land_8_20_14_3_00_38_12]PJB21091.1 MAG: hypothetical protein CO114_07170 [Euryarchaeota archaeon CG_4_9_14_3_um_filter_38_12]
MVMMSFKCKRILMPVEKMFREKKIKQLKKAFGERLKIYTEKKYVVVEGEDLKDYRVRDKVYEILEVA